MHKCNRCFAPLQVYQGRPVKICDRCGAIQADVALPQPFPAPARGKSPAALIVLAGVIFVVLVAALAVVLATRSGKITEGGAPVTGSGTVASPGGDQGERPAAYLDDAQRLINRG
jgi:hypothetical protein